MVLPAREGVAVASAFHHGAGSPHEAPGLPDELALTARIATELRASVLAVVEARGREVAEVAGAIRTAYHTLADLHATQVAVIATRAAPGAAIRAAVGPLGVPVHVVPDVASVSAPTVAEVSDALGGNRLLGGPEA